MWFRQVLIFLIILQEKESLMCVSSKLDNIRSFDAQDDKSEGVCPQFLIIAQIETLQWTGVKIAQEFVKLFNAEIENFYASKIPARRPNSMNNYGAQAKKRCVWCMSTSLGEEKVLITPILFILWQFQWGNHRNHDDFLIEPVENWGNESMVTHSWLDSSTSWWLSRILSTGTAKENLKNPWNHSWGPHCIWTINGLVFVGKSSPEKTLGFSHDFFLGFL